MKKIILFLLVIFSFTALGEDENYIKGKVISHLDTIEETESEEIKFITFFEVEVLEGEEKGRIVELEFPIYSDEAFNIPVRKGNHVVLFKEVDEFGSNLYYITDIDKRGKLLMLIGLFLGIIILLARFKGVRATLALMTTIIVIFYLFLPGVIKGYSPILLSVVTALFSSVITIYFMTGFTQKSHVAILGSIGGVCFAGITSYIFVYNMGLTGFVDVDSLNYAPFLTGIKVKELISAGIILGSMGAVMDVGMSIASALYEVEEVNHDIKEDGLFTIGMNIGSDIIGTMVNTLVLAYVGSSLFTIMMLTMQRSEFPLIRILNFEFIAVELLRSLCGSLGILITVPLTAFLASKLYTVAIKNK